MADPTLPPPNPLAAIATQARGLWQRLPGRARVATIATVIGIVAVIGVLALRPGPAPWKPVVEQLAPADIAELTTLLDAQGIPHRLAKGGRAIEVPAGKLAAARVTAASAGLPRGGVGFELFDGVKLGQSNFAEQVNYRRAIEGELARSIAALAPVEAARVHIALGKRSVFKDADEPPTASVAVRLRAGQTLEPAQVQGVKNLVAGSIDGLTAEQVVIVDQHGNVLSSDDSRRTDDAAQIERTVAAAVRSMLERALGVGKVEVVVRADVDRSKITKSEELYDPAATALRSEHLQGQLGTGAPAGATAPPATTGGIAGVQGNLPGAPAATTTAAGGATPGGATTEIRNWEVSRTTRQTEEAPVRVKKLQVAILVDYRPVEDGDPEPLSDDELAQYASIARTAAGLDESRGDKLEIRSVPFATEPVPLPVPAARPTLPVPLPAILGGGAAVLVAAVLLLSRRRRRAAETAATPTMALPAPLVEVERALEASSNGQPPALLPSAPERSLEERVLAAVRADLPRASRVLASWLSEPEPSPPPAKGAKA